jgi:outer membrane lipoprotein SlyB
MKKLTTSLVVATSVLLTACAQVSGWTPTVDPYNDRNPQMIQQDQAQCDQLASQAAGTGKETAMGAGAGALVGAAGGAITGAFLGNPGMGAAVGAAAGGFGGGAYKGLSSDEAYKRAFINCMRQRGHNVVN